MIDHAKLKAALKTLDSAPKAIDAAKARYRTKMQEIKEMEASGKYAPLNIKTAIHRLREKLYPVKSEKALRLSRLFIQQSADALDRGILP